MNCFGWEKGYFLHFGQGEAHFCGEMVISPFGAFFDEDDFFFFWGGGSPLFGENKAFMAKPSDRPVINDGSGERLNR